MIKNTVDRPTMIPGLRKAAITLVALGDDASAEIFKLLDETEIEVVARRFPSLQRSPPSRPKPSWRSFTNSPWPMST